IFPLPFPAEAAWTTLLFSNATLRRSIGSPAGKISCTSLARTVQSKPPENRTATRASVWSCWKGDFSLSLACVTVGMAWTRVRTESNRCLCSSKTEGLSSKSADICEDGSLSFRIKDGPTWRCELGFELIKCLYHLPCKVHPARDRTANMVYAGYQSFL